MFSKNQYQNQENGYSRPNRVFQNEYAGEN